jgi:glycine/D-amino acid oxidase-like deaminating enzyme
MVEAERVSPGSERADVVVVGAGIVGSAVALGVARAGADVMVLEKHKALGREASGTNAGTVSFQVNKMYTWSTHPFPVDLCVESQKIWASIEAELGADIDYRRTGGFRIAKTEEEVEFLQKVVRDERNQGLDVAFLSGDEARELEPALSGSVIGASYLAEDGRANAYLTTKAFAEAAMRAGARLLLDCKVDQIEVDGSGPLTLLTKQGPVLCDKVVIAAGVGIPHLAESVGLNVPFRVKTNQACVTEPLPTVLTHVITRAGRALSLRQLQPGNILIGGGWDGIPGEPPGRPRVHVTNLANNVQDACGVLRGLESVNIIRAWAASDIRLKDQLPLLGPLPWDERILVAVGDKVGFTLAPLIGKILSDLILTGKTPLPMERFGVQRFREQ